MKIKDRPEFRSKPAPLTFSPTDTVAEAAAAMSARDYGSVIITDSDRCPIGLVTERDIMKRLVNAGLDPKTTQLQDIMTTELRLASEEDEILDWLRIMSNERFRRLPVVDADGRVVAIMTQGDFVSYTWPDLIHQATQLGKATIGRNYQLLIIIGGVLLYILAFLALLGSLDIM